MFYPEQTQTQRPLGQSQTQTLPLLLPPIFPLLPFIPDYDLFINSSIGGGTPGPQGPTGPAGPTGPQGPTGPTAVSNFADFVAVMPPDNVTTIAVGADVEFPVDGPTSATSITRVSTSSFNLATIGSYLVQFQVSVDEPGQLILTINGVDVAYTVSGRATGTNQIVGMVIITTNTVNSVLTLRNPAGNSTALTITPDAGGTRPVSAHIVIVELVSSAAPLTMPSILPTPITGTRPVETISGLVSVKIANANYTASVSDYYIGANTKGITITLPLGITGKSYVVKNQVSENITLKTTDNQQIDNNNTKTLGSGDCIIVLFNGTRWTIISKE